MYIYINLNLVGKRITKKTHNSVAIHAQNKETLNQSGENHIFSAIQTFSRQVAVFHAGGGGGGARGSPPPPRFFYKNFFNKKLNK